MRHPEKDPEEKILKDLKDRCTRCGAVVLSEYSYCGKCGARNPNFDAEEFERRWDCSIYTKRLRECYVGHKKAKATIAPKDLKQSPYCEDCGERIG